MDESNNITDVQFCSFLQRMGVDTYNKSFEWLLSRPDMYGVLEWLYNNLDCNNVLTPREKRRYTEIKNTEDIPTQQELDTIISSIHDEFPGICLPGDQDSIEDVKFDINILQERLNVLEKQENIFKDLLKQNVDINNMVVNATKKFPKKYNLRVVKLSVKRLKNEALSLDITKINGTCQQYTSDDKTTAEECLKLAEEVEMLTEDVIDVIAKTMDVYTSCCDDKEAAQKFYAFGPFEKYKQSQGLFQSHFDLYTSKKFHKITENTTNHNRVLNEAKIVEGRLSDAILSYIESNAELCGEQAKLAYVANYNTPHSSQINNLIIEAQSSVQLLEQEEGILDAEVQNAVKQYVEERTALVEETAAKSALAVREEIHNNLAHLLETTQQALALDKILYGAFRHELRNLEEFLQFATHLRQFVVSENDAVVSRIDSMNEICRQQKSTEYQLSTSDMLLHSLFTIMGTESNDCQLLVKLYDNLHNDIEELKDGTEDVYRKRESALEEYKTSTISLRAYIWDGCTKQPNTTDKTVSSLTHTLRREMTNVEDRVSAASAFLNSVRNKDKQQLRKLWQWFLTDPAKLQSAIKSAHSRSYL